MGKCILCSVTAYEDGGDHTRNEIVSKISISPSSQT